jgi:dolichyl-phosphate-mannose--protein O-mannosyl transferase
MQKGTHQHVSELNEADHPQQSTQFTHFDENKQSFLLRLGSKSECFLPE